MDKSMRKVPSSNIAIYQQLQALEHINIIKILSCEEKEDYSLVEAEEFEGQTIDRILREHEIGKDVFFDWLLQICDALEYLNTAEPPIASVSLQPKNILIGEDNVLKLIDFSNARNTSLKEDAQIENINGVISFMKSSDGKFMEKYDPLLKSLENGKELATIKELRKEIIEAYTSRFGIKRAALIMIFPLILLIVRILRNMA